MTASTEAHAALDLDELARLEAAATPGQEGWTQASAALDIAARNALPALLAIARREPDLLRGWNEENDRATGWRECHDQVVDLLVAERSRADALATQLAEKDALLREAEARCAELVEALEPFAAYSAATDPGDWADDSGEIAEEMHEGLRWSIKLGWLRRAARLASPTIQADQATKAK